MWGALATLTLAACGGGGGESTAASTTPPPSSSTPPPSNDTPENKAPEILNAPELTAKVGATWSFTPDSIDEQNDPLSYTITGKPDWATFNERTGQLSGIPAAGNVGATQDIEITVSDGKDTGSVGPFQILVQAADAPSSTNHAPTITGNPAGVIFALQEYTFLPTGEDADAGDKLTYSISGKPSWLALNTSTGALSGTPTRTQTGVFGNIRLSVSDGKTITSLAPFSITVQPAAITITGTPATTVTVGSAYSFKPAIQDPSTAKFTWSIVNQPIWASFSKTTGALTGTPSSQQAGATTKDIQITATDGKATGVVSTFSITVTAAPNNPPTISGNPMTSVQAGKPYSFTPTASDPNSDPLSYSIANQPPWASFSTTTGQLSGTPTSTNAGKTFAGIVITVSDGRGGIASLPTFAIVVTAASSGTTNRAPVISGTPPTTANVGTAYSFRPTVSDADGDALTFTIDNKPSWANFNQSTGLLSGTPGAGDAGTTNGIVFRVSDGRGGTAALAAFNLTVTAVATGSATLNWMPPTENTDGSALNLAGYRIYYGTSSSNLDQVKQIANPGITTGTVDNLTPATWYFSVRAYSTSGVESAGTTPVNKTIR